MGIKSILWEFYALGYDALTTSLPHKTIRNHMIKVIEEKGSGEILDLGCGTGTMLFALSQKDDKSRIIGIDFSYVMISICMLKQLFWRRGNLQIMRRSADDLQFIQKDSLDIIYSINTLFALPHPDLVLSDLKCKLKSSGLIVLAMPTEKFSSARMMMEHVKLFNKLPLILRISNIGAVICLLPLWVIVLMSNLFISLKERDGNYVTYNKDKLINLLKACDLLVLDYSEILSGQMMIVKVGGNKI